MSDAELIDWAAAEARRFLAPLGHRWAHSLAVGATARHVAEADGVEGDVLVAAAYLHDIGYAPPLYATGHHGIDGAHYLDAIGQCRLARLVAHHSAGAAEAAVRGLEAELARHPPEDTPTADALTFCDLVTDASGRWVTVHQRVADVAQRYGEAHTVTRAMRAALPEIKRAVADTQDRLSVAGVSVHAITGSSRPSR